MFSVCRSMVTLAMLLAAVVSYAAAPLRVCSDPNDLPFSNMQKQGFENTLAEMVGQELQRPIDFVWWPPRARFKEKWLKAGRCDLVMGTTSSSDDLLTTRPYYRSSYVFVSRRDRNIAVVSLTDASLKNYRIGAQIIGDDGETVPPAEEMAQQGLVNNIVGYSLYGDPLSQNPSARIITAVENGDVDLAVAWGPLAGYFARKSAVPLQVTPISQAPHAAAIPVAFSISMGVMLGNTVLRDQLNRFIVGHHEEIRALLLSYGVPLLELESDDTAISNSRRSYAAADADAQARSR
jgi:mxaJ protein